MTVRLEQHSAAVFSLALLVSCGFSLASTRTAEAVEPLRLAAKPAAKASPVKRPAAVNLSGAYTAYLDRLRGKVQPNWTFPDGKNHVTLQVQVEPDGTASNITLSSTPKSEPAEQAANAAFAQVQPLAPLPDKSPAVKVTLTFDSFSDPHGDSNSSLTGRLDPVVPPKSP